MEISYFNYMSDGNGNIISGSNTNKITETFEVIFVKDVIFLDLGNYIFVLIVFGKESHGLPEPLLKGNYDKCIRIPMRGFVRSLNLSNSVAEQFDPAKPDTFFEKVEE